MRKGERVRLTSITSRRGKVFKSLKEFYDRRAIGTVSTEADVIKHVQVQFPCEGGPMSVPIECLQRVRIE